MKHDSTPKERSTLIQLYQEVEAATSREQVFQILKKYKADQDFETGIDWQRMSDD